MNSSLSSRNIGEYGVAVTAEDFSWHHQGRKLPALEDVTFTIPAGRRILVAGASGAGKSTLVAALAGVLSDELGKAGGELLIGEYPAGSRELVGTVGLMLQDPDSQVVSGTIFDDCAFGLENIGVDPEEMPDRVRAALDEVGLDLPFETSTNSLSGGQKQRLALAGCLALGPRLLVLDEPTANIDPEGRAQVIAAVNRVVGRLGCTLIVVEHRIEEWLEVIDDILVLGKPESAPPLGPASVVAFGPAKEIISDHGQSLHDYGLFVPGWPLLDATLTRRTRPRAVDDEGVVKQRDEQAAIVARDLVVGWDEPVAGPLNFTFPLGSSVVITGKNGSGKSTLLNTLAGLIPPKGGQVLLHKERPEAGMVADPIAWKSLELSATCGFVFQDPEHQFATNKVADEMLLQPRLAALAGRYWKTLLFGLGWAKGPDLPSEIVAQVDEILATLGLQALAQASPYSLSGGQKRRLAVASSLVSSPGIVFFDEPTFGQDARTFPVLVKQIRDLNSQGVTVVSVTHDQGFLEALGDVHFDLDQAKAAARAGGDGR